MTARRIDITSRPEPQSGPKQGDDPDHRYAAGISHT